MRIAYRIRTKGDVQRACNLLGLPNTVPEDIVLFRAEEESKAYYVAKSFYEQEAAFCNESYWLNKGCTLKELPNSKRAIFFEQANDFCRK